MPLTNVDTESDNRSVYTESDRSVYTESDRSVYTEPRNAGRSVQDKPFQSQIVNRSTRLACEAGKSLIAKCLAISLVLIALLTFSSLTTHHLPLTFAQIPLDKAKNDYSVQIKKYDQAKEDYITAKSNYAAFNTAASKANAFLKTKEYLVQTNFLIANYLLVIKESSNQISWENLIYNKDTALKPIDEEINYLQENWRQIEKTSKLEDLPPIATQLSAHLANSTKPITNKALTTYEVIKSEQAINRFNQISQKLKIFIEPRVNENNRSIVSNWQSEIDRIKKETETNLALAKSDLEIFVIDRPNDYQKEKVLQSTKLISQELSKSKTLFNEILRII